MNTATLFCFAFLFVCFVLAAGEGSYGRGNPSLGSRFKKVQATDNKLIECGVGNSHNNRRYSKRIIAGLEAEDGQFPWQALLWVDGFRCGGSLIDEWHILTAAHCTTEWGTDVSLPPQKIKILLGSNKMPENETNLLSIQANVKHKQYSRSHLQHDIALLKLEKKVEFKLTRSGVGSVNRVCLPDGTNKHLGQKGVTSGWGYIDYKNKIFPSRLQYTYLKMHDAESCLKDWYLHELSIANIKNGDICGYNLGEKTGTCYGDSGSPLVWKNDHDNYSLVGIFSLFAYSNGNGDCIGPYLFTSVSHHLDWIVQAKKVMASGELTI